MQETGRDNEKIWIELEVQNNAINPEDENIIKQIIASMDKWFGKPRIDTASEAWISIITLKRRHGEDIEEFMLRLDTLAAKLRQAAKPLSDTLLALHLLYTLNVLYICVLTRNRRDKHQV